MFNNNGVSRYDLSYNNFSTVLTTSTGTSEPGFTSIVITMLDISHNNNLRLIMQERGINLNYFVDKERRELIIQNSPEVIEIDGIELNLIYRKHKPLVKEIDEMKISLLNDDIFLKDGRMVHFLDGNKYLTLIQLQEKLSRKT